MKGFFKVVLVLTIFSVIIFLFINQSKDRENVESAVSGGDVKVDYSSSDLSISSRAKSPNAPSGSSSTVATIGEDLSEASAAVSSSLLRPSTSSAAPTAEEKIFSKREPKRYSGHEMAEISPYIRPAQQMYINPRAEAFGGFGVPSEEVGGCVNGDEEVNDAKYLYQCAFILQDIYRNGRDMATEERNAILMKAKSLYIQSASLGHVGAMATLSKLIAFQQVGQENFYTDIESLADAKIESMAWFLAGEMVGAKNMFAQTGVRDLLINADESTVRTAEELALFYIDFYGIPWE